MTDQTPHPNIGLFVTVGMGAGALTGLIIGLIVRRPQPSAHEEISETVDDLKRRAELILSELSKDDVPAPGH